MRLRYDLSVGALYISLSDQAVAQTEEFDGNTNVDLDAAGHLVGIEVISVDHPWAPLSYILSKFPPIPAGELAQLAAYFGPDPGGPRHVLESPKISIASPTPAAA